MRQPIGSVDGIRLDDLIVGFVYDIGTTLGSYLLAQRLAEPADDDAMGLVPPVSEIRFLVITPASEGAPGSATRAVSAGRPAAEPLSEAADRSRPGAAKRRPADQSTS